MKQIKNISLISLLLLAFSSCVDELDNELFTKFTNLKLSGWQETTLNIKEDNTAILPLYFGINGTSGNDKEIQIKVGFDADTLDAYNWEKYKNEKSKYYQQLPEESFTLNKNTFTIKKGDLNTSGYCTIDLSLIEDLYDDYVLPLKITSSIGEPIGPNKYSKALYHIAFKNHFSGNFAGYGTIKEEGTSYTTSANGKTLYAISRDKCYMYVGNVTRDNSIDFKQYIVELTYDETNKKITLSTKNSALNLEAEPVSITRKYTKNTTDLRKYNEETVIVMKYKYNDLSEGSSARYSYEGTLTMNQSVWAKDYPDVPVEDEEE
ncbi:DUF1735 domain-containing protein [Bacteroides sp.]|uniref:DUF1735 domain-containing protein n=1 Tax=Bacteroides sp. TaxID=29523 RepID=UPI0026380E8A|nr:DUF1735 domain-containing protein [Bacteroides sp.]MDD3039311.1 DUF1735 domain-containing protein [Bacteroides sp.]